MQCILSYWFRICILQICYWLCRYEIGPLSSNIYIIVVLYIDIYIYCVRRAECISETPPPNKRASKCTRRIKWKSAKYAEKDHHKKYIYMNVYCMCMCMYFYTSVALRQRPQWNDDVNIRRRHQYKSVHLFLQELFFVHLRKSHRSIYIS